METIRIIITSPDYWYENYMHKTFDVFEDGDTYALRLTDHSRRRIEAFHNMKMNGSRLGTHFDYSGLWIKKSDCKVVSEMNNQDLMFLLKDDYS